MRPQSKKPYKQQNEILTKRITFVVNQDTYEFLKTQSTRMSILLRQFVEELKKGKV